MDLSGQLCSHSAGIYSDIVNNVLDQDTVAFTSMTRGLDTGDPLPHAPILQHPVASSGEPIIALTSGRAYTWGGYGDPLWTIFLIGHGEQNYSATWSDNRVHLD
jgi:hypothetical protein